VLFPLMAAYFTEFTLAGFLTGGLWTATVTALIPVSLLVVLIPYLGPLCGWLPYLVIKGTESVSLAVSSSVPLLYVPAPSQVEMLAYYAIMLTVGVAAEGRLRASAARTARPRSPIRAACVLLCSVLMFASAQIRQSPPWLQVTFLSVGQADCAIVRSGRTTIIVDTATSAALSRSVSGYLRRHGITRVDLCVLSHLHQDHSGGLPGLVMEVPVTSLLVPPGSSEDVEAQLAGLAEQGVAANLPIIVEASSGMTYSVDEMSISVACPDVDPGLGGDENYMSLVAVISSANAHKDGGGPVIEFWGDAPKEEISAYLGSYPSLFTAAKERVVKVPHHGSRSSLADRFYERLGGDAAVISVGNNSYGHPSNEVLDAANRNSVRVWRTDLQGAVTVRFAPPHTSVTSYR